MAKPNMPKATRPRDRTGFQLRSPRCPPVCVRPSHIHTHFAAAWTSARRKFFLSTLRDQHGRSPCPDWPPSFLSVLGGQGSRPEPRASAPSAGPGSQALVMSRARRLGQTELSLPGQASEP